MGSMEEVADCGSGGKGQLPSVEEDEVEATSSGRSVQINFLSWRLASGVKRLDYTGRKYILRTRTSMIDWANQRAPRNPQVMRGPSSRSRPVVTGKTSPS